MSPDGKESAEDRDETTAAPDPDETIGEPDLDGPSRTRLTFRTLIAWLVLAPWLAWAMVRVPGLETGFPAVPIIAYTPFIAATSVIPVLVALVLRSRSALLTSLVVSLLLAAGVAPRAFEGPAPEIEPTGPELVVMTVNLFLGNADGSRVMEIVQREGVDVLATQELTSNALAQMEGAGLRSALPFSREIPLPVAAGSGVFSRVPLGPPSPGFRLDGQLDPEVVGGTLELEGAAPAEILTVHPPSPRASSSVAGWEERFDRLPGADTDGALRIMAGDFNATLDHDALRDLIETGYVDAADAIGQGFTATWPAGQRFPPPVTIDHVLADQRILVTDVNVFNIRGTDHRAVVARLRLPSPEEAQRGAE